MVDLVLFSKDLGHLGQGKLLIPGSDVATHREFAH
jgi:hypothetical protein